MYRHRGLLVCIYIYTYRYPFHGVRRLKVCTQAYNTRLLGFSSNGKVADVPHLGTSFCQQISKGNADDIA